MPFYLNYGAFDRGFRLKSTPEALPIEAERLFLFFLGYGIGLETFKVAATCSASQSPIPCGGWKTFI